MTQPLLEIKNLSVSFASRRGRIRAVENLSLTCSDNETIAIVGESGSGKSVAMLALFGLLPESAEITADTLRFGNADILSQTGPERRRILGSQMAMIFQDPINSLNPCFTVGFHFEEVLKNTTRLNRQERQQRALASLDEVGIPEPEKRLRAYPHQLSGGMCQRVMIALALAGEPRLLVADEPTTALDVTIQAQILDLLRTIQKRNRMTLIIISHNVGLVTEMARRVVVQYAGHKVEEGPVDSVLFSPRHPYTAALLKAIPTTSAEDDLYAIPGGLPDSVFKPPGCIFAPRCDFAETACTADMPRLHGDGTHYARCIKPLTSA